MNVESTEVRDVLVSLSRKLLGFQTKLSGVERLVLARILDAAETELDRAGPLDYRAFDGLEGNTPADDPVQFAIPCRPITEGLRDLLSSLGNEEARLLGWILTKAAISLLRCWDPHGRDKETGDALDTIFGYFARPVPRSFIWYGSHNLFTEELLLALRDEVDAGDRELIDGGQRSTVAPGPHAIRLAESPALAELVTRCAGPVAASGQRIFLCYEGAGASIDPHFDRDEYSVNVLVMVEHRTRLAPPSRLVVFLPGPRMQRITLAPGDLVVFSAGSILHGREPIVEGESVALYSIGFRQMSEV